MFKIIKKIMKRPSGVLLVELPPWDSRVPPLGIAYLATFLKSKGVDTKVFDLNIEMYNLESDEKKKGWGNEDFHWWKTDRLEGRYLSLFEGFSDKILSFDAKVIGFSATLPSIPFLNHLIKYLRKKSRNSIVIVGGPATFFPETRREDFQRELIDYFVVGDGEIALYNLLKGLKHNGTLFLDRNASCKAWKDNPFDRVVCVETPKIMDLDSVPPPTFEEFDLSLYTEGHFCLPIIFSKGCNRSCVFCSDTVLSKPYRCRNPKRVIEEIKMHIKRYPDIETFRLNDLSFNTNLKFLEEFSEMVLSEGLRIKWYGQAQVRPDMDEDLLKKIRKAGCVQLQLGLESFSDHVLSMMRKGYTGKDAALFLKKSKDAGIMNHVALVVGFPGETEKDFKDTIECIRGNSKYIDRICSLNVCGAPVGSDMRNYPQKYGYSMSPDGSWSTSDQSNTPSVRKKRYIDVIICCKECGIEVDGCWDLEIFDEMFGKR